LMQVRLDMAEGRCLEAEQHQRRLMAMPSSRNESSGTYLAAAIQGRGGTMESVHEVLEHTWQLAPERKRELTRLANEANFDLLTGEFHKAQSAEDALSEVIRHENYENDHAFTTRIQFYIAMELGNRNRAGRLASEYLAKRDGWLTMGALDWEIMPLRMEYLAGVLSRKEFDHRRQSWLARVANRSASVEGGGLVAGLNERWQDAYALAAATPEDAADALRVLPQYLPITAAFERYVAADYAIGRVYFLADDIDKALPYLERAAHSCMALHFPVEHTSANLYLGMALEKRGDVSRACAAYGVVLTRWGKEPRSVSAKAARTRSAALHCP